MTDQPIKRGPGRPRKNPIVASSDGAPVVKRGPGRPRKYPIVGSAETSGYVQTITPESAAQGGNDRQLSLPYVVVADEVVQFDFNKIEKAVGAGVPMENIFGGGTPLETNSNIGIKYNKANLGYFSYQSKVMDIVDPVLRKAANGNYLMNVEFYGYDAVDVGISRELYVENPSNFTRIDPRSCSALPFVVAHFKALAEANPGVPQGYPLRALVHRSRVMQIPITEQERHSVRGGQHRKLDFRVVPEGMSTIEFLEKAQEYFEDLAEAEGRPRESVINLKAANLSEKTRRAYKKGSLLPPEVEVLAEVALQEKNSTLGPARMLHPDNAEIMAKAREEARKRKAQKQELLSAIEQEKNKAAEVKIELPKIDVESVSQYLKEASVTQLTDSKVEIPIELAAPTKPPELGGAVIDNEQIKKQSVAAIAALPPGIPPSLSMTLPSGPVRAPAPPPQPPSPEYRTMLQPAKDPEFPPVPDPPRPATGNTLVCKTCKHDISWHRDFGCIYGREMEEQCKCTQSAPGWYLAQLASNG